jgi:hypothetical protein
MRACLDRRDIDGTYRVGAEALAYDEDEAAKDKAAPEPEGEEGAGIDELGWPTPHILRHTRAP